MVVLEKRGNSPLYGGIKELRTGLDRPPMKKKKERSISGGPSKSGHRMFRGIDISPMKVGNEWAEKKSKQRRPGRVTGAIFVD